MRREHNEDADDMSEQRMSRATKLGDADHLRSSREEAKLNAASVWAVAGRILFR